jgi:hypothetical protein
MNLKQNSIQEKFSQALTKHGQSMPKVSPIFLDKLAERIDDSPFDLAEWATAWTIISQWLSERNLKINPDEQLEYLSCVCEGVTQGKITSAGMLKAATHDYLNQHGIERAVKQD